MAAVDKTAQKLRVDISGSPLALRDTETQHSPQKN